MSIYLKENVFITNGRKDEEGRVIERLFNHPEGIKYREILDRDLQNDNYDYIEDEEFIEELDAIWEDFQEETKVFKNLIKLVDRVIPFDLETDDEEKYIENVMDYIHTNFFYLKFN